MNSTSTRKVVLIIVGCLLVVGFAVWRYLAAGRLRPIHSAIVFDGSESSANKCACLSALAGRSLAASGAGDATLTVFATGDETTANEPVLIVRYQVPQQRKVMEGRAAGQRQKDEVLRDLELRCQQLVPARRSPVFYAVKRGVEHLQSLGCGAGSDCVLFVASDGEETVDQRIKQAIAGRVSKGEMTLPSPIPNEGIRVVFCGLAETNGSLKSTNGKTRRLTADRNAERANRLREVWTGLFTATQLVTFEPFCAPSATLPGQPH